MLCTTTRISTRNARSEGTTPRTHTPGARKKRRRRRESKARRFVTGTEKPSDKLDVDVQLFGSYFYVAICAISGSIQFKNISVEIWLGPSDEWLCFILDNHNRLWR